MAVNEVVLHNDLIHFNSLSSEQKLEKYLQLKAQEIHYQENLNCWELRFEKPIDPFLEKDLGKKFLLNEEKNKIRGDRLKMGGMFGGAACVVAGLGGSILFPPAAPAFVFGVMSAGGYSCLAASGIGKAIEVSADKKLNGFDNNKRKELIQKEIKKANNTLEQQRIYNRSFEKEILLEIEKGNLKTKNINSIDDLNQIIKEKENELTQKSREIKTKYFNKNKNQTLNVSLTQEVQNLKTSTINEPTLEIKQNEKYIEPNQAKEQEQQTQIKNEVNLNFAPNKETDTMQIDKPQSQSLAFSSNDLDMIDNTIDNELAFQDVSNLESMEADINEFNIKAKSQDLSQNFQNELEQIKIPEQTHHEQEIQIAPEATHQTQTHKLEVAQDFTAQDLSDMSYAFAINKFELDKSATNFKEVEMISSVLKHSIGDEYLSTSEGGTTAFQSLMSLDDAIRQSNERNGTFATHKVSFSIKADGKEYKNFNVFLGDNPSAFGKDFDYLVAMGQPEIIENRSKVNKMFDFIKDKNSDGKYKNILENGSRFVKNTMKDLAEQMQQLSAFSPEAQALIAGFVKSYFIENSNNKINYKPNDKESNLINQVNDMKQQLLSKDEKSQIGDIDIAKLAANIKIDKTNNARQKTRTNQPNSREL